MNNDPIVHEGLVGVELSGRTLGILGTGRIGTHAARIGHGFGMKTVAYDIVKSPRLEEMYSTRYLPLEKVLEAADCVTIQLPLNKADIVFTDPDDSEILLGERDPETIITLML